MQSSRTCGQNSVTNPSAVDRFVSRLTPQPNGCLEWQGARDRDGYGVMEVDGH